MRDKHRDKERQTGKKGSVEKVQALYHLNVQMKLLINYDK